MKWLSWSLLLGLLLISGLSVYLAVFGQEKEVYHIAVAGPMSGPNSELGAYMRRGAELAIAEANADGRLPEIELRALIADDESEYLSRYRPGEVAGELVEDPRLLAVVGHYFSTPSIVTAPVYAKHEIPMISPTATHPEVTAGNDRTFSMIYSDEYQGMFLANYVTFALKRKRVAVIHSTLPYGENLKTYFVSALAGHGIAPMISLSLSYRQPRLESLEPYLETLQSAEIILLAMRYDNAARVAKYLRNKQITTDFVGGENVGSFRFIQEAGIYAENTYAVTSFLPNLLGQKARVFEQRYAKTFDQPPNWIAAHAYEATQLLIRAIEKEGPNRLGIYRFLQKLRGPRKAMHSMGGPIYFDKHGMNLRSASIGKVVNGRYISAEYQAVPIKYPELIPDGKNRDNLLTLGSRILKRSTVVFTGMHIHEIESLKVAAGYFKAKFNLWFRWNAKEKSEIGFELLNGNLLKTQVVEQYTDPESHEKYVAYLLEAEFNQEFPLHEYPFDVQTLKIQVKPKGHSTEDVILVKDFATDNYLAEPLDLGLWVDAGHLEYVNQDEYIHSFRNPRFDKKTYRLSHAVFNYDITVHRKVTEYMIKLMPLLIVMLAAYLTFFLDVGTALPPRLAIGITALLSAVAFHMSQSTNVIHIGYLIKADYFFMMTYWLIFFSLAEAVVAKQIYSKDKAAQATALDWYSSWAYLFLIVFSVIFLIYL